MNFAWLAQVASVAIAQAGAGELEEVTVTARRLEEPYRLVALTIDVLERDRLMAATVVDLASLARVAPGLYFESLWGGEGSAPTLRGQSQPSSAGDNVGVFVDGVYQAARSSVDVPQFDLERIEVVHGPQSALFGHSTFTGAIHYVTRAPTHEFTGGTELGVGTDDHFQAGGYLSGPLPGGALLGRLAADARRSAGTWSGAEADADIGDVARYGVSGALELADGGAFGATLSARWFEAESGHPAQVFIDAAEYDCGAVDPISGYWSYYCGSLPHQGPVRLSAGVPDSRNEAAQASLEWSWSGGAVAFRSTTGYYRGRSDAYRDFDSSSAGESFGVCSFEANCPGLQPAGLPVSRFVTVNSVSRRQQETSEWTQEFRLYGSLPGRLEWLAGLAGFSTESENAAGFGFERGDLAPDEALTVILPLSPGIAGPLARGNRALVDDPNREQVLQARDRTSRRTLAAFGALTWRPVEKLALRTELRTTRERTKVDSVLANFEPSFGTAIAAQEFSDTTPRFSVDYAPVRDALVYASAAKGSRSGGVNPIPGLLPSEQAYGPEYNWTYELSARYAEPARRWRGSVTVYRIDWRDTQIIGLPVTPGIANLITSNTAGVDTRGLELSFQARLDPRLSLHAAYSRAEAEFAAGSDDAGSSAFCGLRGGNQASTLCRVGPPRSGLAPPGSVVPYVDGNALQRAPRVQWLVGLDADLAGIASAWNALASVDLSGQDDVFDRPINGAHYGERTLLSARIALLRGPWTLELWGTNLTDERYLRAVSSRGAAFYPVAPRPLDLVLGDRRRIGITVHFDR